MNILFWSTLGFLSGSLPFSVWLGRWLARADVRAYGDGNPGAANAVRAGGWRVGLPVLLLDFFKGAVPVGLAHFLFSVSGWGLLPVALAPVLGHAFSPFLRFQGGKAVAATFGVWTGLMLGEAPIVLGAFVVLFLLVQSADAWTVVLSMLGLLAHLLLRHAPPDFLAIGAGNLAILLWKHRRELRQPIRPRPWVSRLLGRSAR